MDFDEIKERVAQSFENVIGVKAENITLEQRLNEGCLRVGYGKDSAVAWFLAKLTSLLA